MLLACYDFYNRNHAEPFMQHAIQHLKSRLIVLAIIGLLVYLIDFWMDDDSSASFFILRIILYVVFLFAILADEVRGTLKSSPIYKATISEATSVQFVKVSIMLYFILLAVIALQYLFYQADSATLLIKPLTLYFYLLPIILLIFAGKFIIEKEQNSELDQ